MSCLAYGFCGMPCALCPYYHTKGKSRCMGCSHDGFFTGTCRIYKCCKTNNLSHCALCDDYPCTKCAALKEFNCLNTDGVWIRTVSEIQSEGFEKWYSVYNRKAELLNVALEKYNNGKMKRYLCELFINNDISKIEQIMDKATSLTGTQKEISNEFRNLVCQIIHA